MNPSEAEKGHSNTNATRSSGSHGTGFWRSIYRLMRLGSQAKTAKAGSWTGGKQKPVSGDVPSTAPRSDDGPGKDKAGARYTKAEQESACAKLWSVYVGEAERYDRGLVESWKGDMNGMLIFSGLFSASLTAFIIESYKTLQPDPEDSTVALLTQISLQLAAASGATIPDAEALPPFQASPAALVCNVLWFISLALSLTCSLLATLVEQWAREFLHKTEIHPAPVRRARVFSFLYLGLKQFRMHIVVDIIPMLLHVSLFLFFGGLIAFLLPVNAVLMYLMGGILAVFLVLYMILTVLPVVRRASPYRTPLSGALWRLKQACSKAGTPNHDRSMMQAVSDEALKDPQMRDRHAVQWTISSLTDDSELLPLVEAIPDVICGPKGFYNANDHLFIPLLHTSDPQLSIVTRTLDLLRSSDDNSLDIKWRHRREVACLKAIWALAMMPNAGSFQNFPVSLWQDWYMYPDSSLRGYGLSARAAVSYSRRNILKRRMKSTESVLERRNLSSEVSERETLQTVQGLFDGLHEIDISMSSEAMAPVTNVFSANEFPALQDFKSIDISSLDPTAVSTLLDTTTNRLKRLTTGDPSWNCPAHLDILDNYLVNALHFGSCPYHFLETCERLLPHWVHLEQFEDDDWYPFVFYRIPDPSRVESMTPDIHDIDTIVMQCIRFLPFLTHSRPEASVPLYRYLSKRKISAVALLDLMNQGNMELLLAYISTDLRDKGQREEIDLSKTGIFETIWILCECMLMMSVEELAGRVLSLLNDLYSSLRSYPFSSTLAIISHLILDNLELEVRSLSPDSSVERVNAVLSEVQRHPLLSHTPRCKLLQPPISFQEVHEARETLRTQLLEMRLLLVGQLLAIYSPAGDTPHEGVKTINILGNYASPSHSSGIESLKWFDGPVRLDTQRTVVNALRSVMDCLTAKPTDAELNETINAAWDLSTNWHWLTDADCVTIFKKTADIYLALDGPDKGREEDYNSPLGRFTRIRKMTFWVWRPEPGPGDSASTSSEGQWEYWEADRSTSESQGGDDEQTADVSPLTEISSPSSQVSARSRSPPLDSGSRTGLAIAIGLPADPDELDELIARAEGVGDGGVVVLTKY